MRHRFTEGNRILLEQIFDCVKIIVINKIDRNSGQYNLHTNLFPSVYLRPLSISIFSVQFRLVLPNVGIFKNKIIHTKQ